MARSQVERRLQDVTERLRRAREELAVVNEQFTALSDAADEARIRAVVAETPLAEKEWHEAQRHADAMGASRIELAHRIEDLQRSQDTLLDRIVI